MVLIPDGRGPHVCRGLAAAEAWKVDDVPHKLRPLCPHAKTGLIVYTCAKGNQSLCHPFIDSADTSPLLCPLCLRKVADDFVRGPDGQVQGGARGCQNVDTGQAANEHGLSWGGPKGARFDLAAGEEHAHLQTGTGWKHARSSYHLRSAAEDRHLACSRRPSGQATVLGISTQAGESGQGSAKAGHSMSVIHDFRHCH